MKLGIACALMATLAGGCATERARVALLSTSNVGGLERIGSEVVVGKDCGGGLREGNAVRDALRQSPEADALAQIEMADFGACAVVMARPVRFKAGAEPLERDRSTDVAHDGSRAEPGKARVYVYRMDIGSSFRDAVLYLGNAKPIELDDREIQDVTLDPGLYSGELRRADLRVPFRDLELEADRVYYLRITGTNSSQQGLVMTNMAWSVQIEIRDPAFARADLRMLSARHY